MFKQIITAIILLGGAYGVRAINKQQNIEAARTAARKGKKGGKGNVDKEFWERIAKLVKHIIPSWNCPEMHCTIALAILLIIRTMMSIWLADVNGRVVKAIVNKDLKQFL